MISVKQLEAALAWARQNGFNQDHDFAWDGFIVGLTSDLDVEKTGDERYDEGREAGRKARVWVQGLNLTARPL